MTDDFEWKLARLTSSLRRPDPTAAWKGEILARAQARSPLLPPRWLAIPLATAWALIFVLEASRLVPSGRPVDQAGSPPVPMLFVFHPALESELTFP